MLILRWFFYMDC